MQKSAHDGVSTLEAVRREMCATQHPRLRATRTVFESRVDQHVAIGMATERSATIRLTHGVRDPHREDPHREHETCDERNGSPPLIC